MKIHHTNKKRLVKRVFQDVFDKYDLMNDLMSLGIHRLWKKNFIHWLNPQKNTILIDVASGTGDIAKLYLNEINYRGSVCCVDENKAMLDLNKRKFKVNANVKWFCNSAEKLPFKNNHFDYYTISFGIRNVNNLNNTLKEAYRVLKPGGRFFCLEFSKVENEILNDLLPRNISTLIFKAFLENAASEQGSRMTAMDSATRNAGDLIDRLTINYNRSRQAAITKELIEIISGAESL